MNRGSTFRYWVFGTLGLVLFAECLYFLLLPRGGDLPERVDLLIVFQGAEARSRAAYHLMHRTQVSHFFVPGASRSVLQANDRRYGIPDAVLHIPSLQRTHSTCEDAFQASQVIRRLAPRQAVLITSGYHVPRSLFLLRLLTLGSGCRIQPMGVAGHEPDERMLRKNINEMIKLWGSLIQLAYHGLTGHHLSSAPQLNRFFNRIEGWLLF